MNPALTPPNESTMPASSETSTTPTAGGGMSGTGKKQDPSVALMRERQRRKKALVKIRALEALIKSYQEDEIRLNRALGDQLLRNEKLEANVAYLAQRLNWLASCKVKQDGPARAVEITSTVRIDLRQIERGSTAYRYIAAEDVCRHLNVTMTEQMMTGLVKSPLTLRSHPDAELVYQRQKQKWLHEIMMDPKLSSIVYHIFESPAGALAFYDRVAEEVINAAKQVPPDTEIKWVVGRGNPWDARHG